MSRAIRPTAAQLRALARRDRALGAAMKRLPPYPGFPERGGRRSTHYEALADAIVYQQLAGKAAATIRGRVCDLTSGPRFPSAPELLALPDEKLRGAGLSRNKLAALRDLATRVEDGSLRLRGIGRCDEDEIIDRLTAVRGIGPWSAHMFLMFRLGRLDVMAPADLGLQEGLRILDGLAARPKPRDLLERAERWRPLRTVAAWYLWRLVHEHREAAREGL